MKLHEVKLKNFRGFKDEVSIPIKNLTAFIGKNDVGKSTILEALEIFFNSNAIECEKEDLNIHAMENIISITCIFDEIPNSLVIDTTNQTSLIAEHLLNSNGMLEIKKVFTATSAKPKEKVFIVCSHPTVSKGNDLLLLKKAELKERAQKLSISETLYNANVNSSIRKAIWDSFIDLEIQNVDLLVDKEDTKKVYEALKTYIPIFALFQSDRKSKDDDKEVTDPMKFAIQQAIQELDNEIDQIKTKVHEKALESANRTLEKLKEMAPQIAKELIPVFKTEPKFDSLFKLTFSSEDEISINKRGSGVRRLILLNFFRAEAERKRENISQNVIYAFEEPETSQHPNHQEMLINAFLELSHDSNTQILLTTHTPAIAGLLPLDSLRLIEENNGIRTIQLGSDDVYEKISNTLGLLPNPFDKNAKAILLVEGKSDVTFIKHTAEKLKEGGFINNTFEEKRIAVVPIGGCGNLKHWQYLKLADQFHIPYCVLIDSDKGTNEEPQNLNKIQELRQQGIKAYVTLKREPENYLHFDCLPNPIINYNDTDDAKKIIKLATGVKETLVLETYWPQMTVEQIREMEKYTDTTNDHYEFTEMFTDFLTLVN